MTLINGEQIKKLEAERDALAAQVAGIKDEISDFLAALDGMLMADLSSEEIADDLEKRLSNYDVPQQHLAEIRAQAVTDFLHALYYAPSSPVSPKTALGVSQWWEKFESTKHQGGTK